MITAQQARKFVNYTKTTDGIIDRLSSEISKRSESGADFIIWFPSEETEYSNQLVILELKKNGFVVELDFTRSGFFFQHKDFYLKISW